jgi:hypothetical protein
LGLVVNNSKLANDDSLGTRARIYQVLVALEKCFELESGQKVLIEREGDVSLLPGYQYEVKLQTAPITDCSVSFWKTLNNWMMPEFDEAAYQFLILLTTQEISDESLFAKWNQSDVDQRILILDQINRRVSEAASVAKISKRPVGSKRAVSRERILSPDSRDRLRKVVGKVVISGGAKAPVVLFDSICDRYAKGVLKGKREDFVDDLLGFIVGRSGVVGDTWEISYDSFESQVQAATARYCRDTREFPQKFLLDESLGDQEGRMLDDKLFVQKIKAIEYEEVLADAVRGYMVASKTVQEEFSSYQVPPRYYDSFEEEVRSNMRVRYRQASRNCDSEIIRNSKNYYDSIMVGDMPSIVIFSSVPRIFYQGVVQMQCDADKHAIHWKLKRDE